MIEQERKYSVPAGFRMPDLAAAVPDGGRVVSRSPVTLTAIYFDTPDLRLARSGVSLRHRDGDREPWTVKLPADAPGTRHEISRPGPAQDIPPDLAALVTVHHRGAPLRPLARVVTVRQRHEIRDRDDTRLVEIADDEVTTLTLEGGSTSAFREVEVERGTGEHALLDRVESLLTAGGARVAEFVPKHVRAFGPAAEGPPERVDPAGVPPDPTAGDVVTDAIRRGVRRILRYDPLVRLGAEAGDVDAVRKMRVGCRRLRSDLRTFAPLVEPGWARPLRDELSWLGGRLGEARDIEVLRARLRRTAGADPISPLDEAAVNRLDAALATRQQQATAAIEEVLGAPRYLALVEALVQAARAPQLTARADTPAAKALPRLVGKAWRRLARGNGSHGGIAALAPLAPDEVWHAVRREGKRARYALEAVAPVIGGDAAALARSLRETQALLGEHQDAAVAAETWTALAREHPDDPALAVTAGRLAERERAAVRRARADFPRLWRRTTRRHAGWPR